MNHFIEFVQERRRRSTIRRRHRQCEMKTWPASTTSENVVEEIPRNVSSVTDVSIHPKSKREMRPRATDPIQPNSRSIGGSRRPIFPKFAVVRSNFKFNWPSLIHILLAFSREISFHETTTRFMMDERARILEDSWNIHGVPLLRATEELLVRSLEGQSSASSSQQKSWRARLEKYVIIPSII